MSYIGYLARKCYDYRGKWFYKNLKPSCTAAFLHNVFFLLKHGYSEEWTYENFSEFIRVQKESLEWLRRHHVGNPMEIWEELDADPNHSTENDEAAADLLWESKLHQMCKYLHDMNKRSSTPEEGESFAEYNAKIDKAKEEFFKMYSHWFFNLWD